MFDNINSITFIISEICNLKCSYCEIAKRENKFHLNEVDNIKESLYSGAYVQNYKTFFNKYNIDINKIINFALWGQEPTLVLEAFNTQITSILDWLPNLNNMFFSTNGVDYAYKIIELIKIFNNYFLNNNREFKLTIQFSFDGLEYTQLQRGIDPYIIINNIKYIINNLNNIELFKDFKINFILHGVINFNNIISQLDNKLGDQYWSNNANIIQNLTILNKNKNVSILPFGAYLIFPYNATPEEGKLLTQYANFCFNDTLKDNKNIHILSPFNLILDSIINIKNRFQEEIDTEQQIINEFNYDYGNDDIFNTDIYKNYGCAPNTGNIKMRYDGLLFYCQNTMFNIFEQDLIGKTGIDYDLSYFQIKHPNFYPNVLKDNPEQIEKFVNLMLIKEHYPHSLTYSNIVNLMFLLLQNGQIDQSYRDSKKLLKHAFYLSRFQQCFHAHMIETGSFYGISIGTIRAYCNGTLDLAEEYVKKNGWRRQI